MTILNRHKHGIPQNSVYVGRGSVWGNPFAMKNESQREEVISKYNCWLKEQIKSQAYTLEQLAYLSGKDLVCYCAPRSCHADSLEKVALWAFRILND